MSYINHSMNLSPTIAGVAGGTIADPSMLALKVSSGKLVVCGAGEQAIGIALADANHVTEGTQLDVQIKEGCLWIAGDTVSFGDELTSDANGKAVTATEGDYVLAIALEDGVAGQPINVQIVKSGTKAGGSTEGITLADLGDVDLTGKTDGYVLKYEESSQKWKPAADATT